MSQSNQELAKSESVNHGSSQEASPSSTAAEYRAHLILNVNDDDANRYSIGRILTRAGFSVLEASSGAGALLEVQKRPDLVVLDVQLPDIDGFEVCRRIKSDPILQAIPVLHLSAKYVRQSDRTHGLESGADGYLVLPVEQPELLSTVRNLLQLRDAHRTIAASKTRVEELEKELQALESLTPRALAPVTGRSYGTTSLRESHPAVFDELVVACDRLLDIAMTKSEYRMQPELVETVRALSDRLGFLRAGPRDVIEVYSAAIKHKTANNAAPRAKALLEEGRLLVLELMGHLVSYYRSVACIPIRRESTGEAK
jgi:CheY-like chemotaxis protein